MYIRKDEFGNKDKIIPERQDRKMKPAAWRQDSVVAKFKEKNTQKQGISIHVHDLVVRINRANS